MSSREYGRVATTFWTSRDIAGLTDAAKLLALYLISGPHTTMLGCFRLPEAYVAEDLGWTGDVVAEAFRALVNSGFVLRDETRQWVLVRKFLAWNKIANPGQATSLVRLFEMVPDAAAVKPPLAQAIKDHAEESNTKSEPVKGLLSQAVRKYTGKAEQAATQPSANVAGTLPEPWRDSSGTVPEPWRDSSGTVLESGAGTGGSGSGAGRTRSKPPTFLVDETWQPPDFVGKRLTLAGRQPTWSPANVQAFIAHHRSKGISRGEKDWGELFVSWMIREASFGRAGPGGDEGMREKVEAVQRLIGGVQ